VTKDRTAYYDFLTVWRDADPDIPVFIVAKSEYASCGAGFAICCSDD
jgi:hypothetical protein